MSYSKSFVILSIIKLPSYMGVVCGAPKQLQQKITDTQITRSNIIIMKNFQVLQESPSWDTEILSGACAVGHRIVTSLQFIKNAISSSQCTSPEHPASCIEPGLVICFIYDNIHVSMLFSQIIPPSPSPTESKRLFCTSVGEGEGGII